MTTLLARLGPVEKRLATAPSRWTPGKRKREAEWICRSCRNRTVGTQRRMFGDDALRLPDSLASLSLTNARGKAEIESRRPSRSAAKLETSSWGRDDEFFSDSGVARRPGAVDIEELDSSSVEEHVGEMEEIMQGAQIRSIRRSKPKALSSSDFDVDYKTELSKALVEEQCDLAFQCVLAALRANDREFVQGLSNNTFSALLTLLRPTNFTSLADTHAQLSPARLERLRLSTIEPFIGEASNTLHYLIEMLRAFGRTLCVADYEKILLWTQELGDVQWATEIWANIHHESLKPSRACYSSFMGTIASPSLVHPLRRQRQRVIKHYMEQREKDERLWHYQDYGVGKGGIKEQTTRLLSQMMMQGIAPDEASFCYAMTAAAKEGDLSTVKNLLLRGWNVNIDEVIAGNPQVSETPRYPSGSEPSALLLETIAYAFGINYDVPAGLRVIDYLGRQFHIKVNHDVWLQLLERTLVTSKERTGTTKHARGEVRGRLSQRSVSALFDTMTSEPYDIDPSAPVYNALFHNLAMRDAVPRMLEALPRARELVLASRKYAVEKLDEWTDAVKQKTALPASSGSPFGELQVFRRAFEKAEVERKRDHMYLRTWVALILERTSGFVRADPTGDCLLRRIPKLILRYPRITPTIVQYDVPGGIVEFSIRNEETTGRHRKVKEEYEKHIAWLIRHTPLAFGEGTFRLPEK